jgi:hypothetical protein
MIPKSMPSGFDPMGENRFSEKIMLRRNIWTMIRSNLIGSQSSDGEGDATSAHDPGDRFGSRVCVLQACSGIEAPLRSASRARPLFDDMKIFAA